MRSPEVNHIQHEPKAHLLTQVEAARWLRLSERTLERLRLHGGGPMYVKAGRSVRYREADLEAWIAARVVSSTSEVVS